VATQGNPILALKPEAIEGAQDDGAIALPIDAQCTVDVRIVSQRWVDRRVANKDPNCVAIGAQTLRDTPAVELIAARVRGRVEVGDRKDTHRGSLSERRGSASVGGGQQGRSRRENLGVGHLCRRRILSLKVTVLIRAWKRRRVLMYYPLRAVLPLAGPAADRDIRRQLQPRLDLPLPGSYGVEQLTSVLGHRPFRSILYHRLRQRGFQARVAAKLLSAVYHGEPAFYLTCDDIGAGLMMMHGFATIVVAHSIGEDCQIAQQVTIGYDDRGAPPTIGDRVRIGAGAIVVGPITVGADAVVGAGAVVVRDVPAGAVVGGVPAKVLPGATDRFSARQRIHPG
jgi:serine O-acetyltransferase